MDTDSFMVQVKSEDIYTYLAGGLKKIIETSKYELKNPLPIGKNNKERLGWWGTNFMDE